MLHKIKTDHLFGSVLTSAGQWSAKHRIVANNNLLLFFFFHTNYLAFFVVHLLNCLAIILNFIEKKNIYLFFLSFNFFFFASFYSDNKIVKKFYLIFRLSVPHFFLSFPIFFTYATKLICAILPLTKQLPEKP